MEKVKKKYDVMVQALDTLSKAIENLKNVDKDFDQSSERYQDHVLAYRDSVVKRFEYCADNIWKYIRLYLEEVKLVSFKTNSPKDTFRTAFQAKFLTEEQTELALEMITSRNHTSHIYKEEFADFVATKAPVYCELMISILEKMKP